MRRNSVAERIYDDMIQSDYCKKYGSGDAEERERGDIVTAYQKWKFFLHFANYNIDYSTSEFLKYN